MAFRGSFVEEDDVVSGQTLFLTWLLILGIFTNEDIKHKNKIIIITRTKTTLNRSMPS